MIARRIALAALGSAALLAASTLVASTPWEQVEAEPDLEKRSGLALEFARGQVDQVVADYLDGRPGDARTKLKQIVTAVELAQASLVETGKTPRKKPKHFKRAEIATRKLVNDLKQAQRKLTFDERPDLDPVIARLEQVNQQLLLGIFERNK